MAHILSLSYGKDSLACLEACRLLGYPIDRVIHAEVWATDTIPADFPTMVSFKQHADKVIKERYNLVVEHIAATTRERERERDGLITSPSSIVSSKREAKSEEYTDSRCKEENGVIPDLKCKPSTLSIMTYERFFYQTPKRKYEGKFAQGTIHGFPLLRRPWCNSRLKTDVLDSIKKSFSTAPLHKELIQILCSISVLPQMNRSESRDTRASPVPSSHW